MPGNPKAPMIGELSIDATDCASYAVDLPPGGRLGLLFDHDGVDLAVAEISSNQAMYGDRAGVTKGDFDQLNNANTRIQQIDLYLASARKMAEILEETRAQQVDLRERAISSIGHSIDARARQSGNGDLLAKYEATRAYRSEIANRGAKTRKKNAEGKAKEKAAAGASGNGAPGGVTSASTTTGNGAPGHS